MVAFVTSLTTLGLCLPSSVGVFPVTKLLACVAAERIWNIYRNRNSQVADCDLFWNSRSSESNDEDVRVSTTSWVVFDRDVTLCSSSSLRVSLLSQSISGVRLLTFSQVFSVLWQDSQPICPAYWLCDSETLDWRCLISLTVHIAVFIALSIRNRDSLDSGCSWLNNKPVMKGVDLVCVIVRDFKFCTRALVARCSVLTFE